jgi:hypothetical protein
MDDTKWGVILLRNDAVTFWSIADATLILHDLAKEKGGEYDGWETPVVTSADAKDAADDEGQ